MRHLLPFLIVLSGIASAGDPDTLPGCVLWLDGSDVDGDDVEGGSFASGTTWVDRSGNGASAAQLTAARRPQVVPAAWNGRSIVRFDGNDFMDVLPGAFGMLNGVNGATIFAVASTPVTDNNQRVFMVSNGANSGQTRAGLALFDQFGTSIAGIGDYGAAGRRLDTDGFQRVEGGTINLGALEQYAATFDYGAGELGLYVAGALETLGTSFQTPGPTSATDSLNIRLGADAALNALRGEFTGDLAEVIVFDRVLSNAERVTVEQYLHLKWFTPSLGVNYCTPAVINSTGSPASLSAAGSSLVAANDVTLTADDLPQNSFGYFLTSRMPGFVPLPGGSQGNICLGGDIGRYITNVASSGDGGCLVLEIDLTSMPQPTGSVPAAAGETWHFQAWFRDSVGGLATSNFTDGLAVSFL